MFSCSHQVQTEDQYMFIHDALLEAIVAGSSEVAARALHAHIQRLLTQDTDATGMEAEFKMRCCVADTTGMEAEF